jgi:hypothetical protein
MPKAILDYMGYKFYFWSNENDEPIHVHVSKGKPRNNATKFWIKRNGTVELANNNSQIEKSDLKFIQKYICANRLAIIAKWYETFGL